MRPLHRLVPALSRRLRPRPVDDATIAARVASRVANVLSERERIAVTVEHGCVVLRGTVLTRERPRLVQSLARVAGFDSIVDMLEERSPARAPERMSSVRRESPRLVPGSGDARRGPSVAIRTLAIGAGAAVWAVGLAVRGRLGAALGLVGAALVAGGAVAGTRRRSEQPSLITSGAWRPSKQLSASVGMDLTAGGSSPRR